MLFIALINIFLKMPFHRFIGFEMEYFFKGTTTTYKLLLLILLPIIIIIKLYKYSLKALIQK